MPTGEQKQSEKTNPEKESQTQSQVQSQSMLSKLKHFVFEKEYTFEDFGVSSKREALDDMVKGAMDEEDDTQSKRFSMDAKPDENAEKEEKPRAKTTFQRSPEKLKPSSFFREDERNFIFVEGVTFTENSKHNACQIWGEDKLGIFSGMFKKQTMGLKKILENKAVETGILFTDIIIGVHTDDFKNIGKSSDLRIATEFDNGNEEIEFLKSWANQYFLNNRNSDWETLIPDRNFHFAFRRFNYDKLKNAFLVVLKKNVFIIDSSEDPTILADITVTCSGKFIKKTYYQDKRCFLIGAGKFDDISVGHLPDDIELAFTFEGNRPNLEYPIDWSAEDTDEDTVAPKKQMKSNLGETWFIESESNPDGILAKITKKSKAEEPETEFATVTLTLRKQAKKDIKDTPDPKEHEVIPPEPETVKAEKTGVTDHKTQHFRRIPSIKPHEGQGIGRTQHISRVKRSYKTLIRTHRFIPYPIDNESYAVCVGGAYDWCLEEEGKVKIRWNRDQMELTALKDELTWNGGAWSKGTAKTLSNTFGEIKIRDTKSSFVLNMDSDVRPLMTFEDGEKDFFHWARLDTGSEQKIQITSDILNIPDMLIIGRGEYTINTSPSDSIDQRLIRLKQDEKTNKQEMDLLNELKKNLGFSSIMSNRYHAAFDHELQKVVNLNDIPIFIFETGKDGKLTQRIEVPGLPRGEWCNKCQKIMDNLGNQPPDNLKAYAVSHIFAENGFIRCEACNKKRKESEFLPGQYLVVGNAMFLFEHQKKT